MARRSKLVLGAVAGCVWALSLVLVARAAMYGLPVADTVTVHDQVSASTIPAIRPSPSDSASLTDQVIYILESAIRPALSDAATVGDQVSATPRAAFRPALGDSATIGDQVIASLRAAFRPALGDTATVGDQVSATLRAAFRPALTDTATVRDQVNARLAAVLRPTLADTATVGDQVNARLRAAFRPALGDTATVGDQVNARLAAVFRPALRDSAGIGDQVSVVFVVRTTSTTISSSKNPSAYGDTVTLSAAVTASGSTPGSADGTVTFTDGVATLCGAVSLNASGQATCSNHLLTAGTHTVTATYSGSSRFTASNATLSQQVNPAPLVVTANDATKVYGYPNPAFTVRYSGFVNGDTPASLGGTLAFGTSATQGSSVGVYQVTPSGLTSANYSISFVSGTLTILPAAPLITAPSDGFSTSSSSVTVSGTGLAGASITVRDGGSMVATATVDVSGNWSAALTLAIGAHSLSATQTFNSLTSAASNTVHLNVVPAAPVITSPSDGFSTTSGSLTVSGTGLAGASIAVRDGSITVATSTVDASGSWSASLSLAIGAHSLSATQTFNSQTSTASTVVHLYVLPVAPVITSPSDGFSTTTGSLTVTVSGTGLANASITLRDGGATVATATANASGNWSAGVALAVGAHSLSATQTFNGQTSAASSIVHVIVLDADLALTGMPGPITANATGPGGAVVIYTAPTAVDEAADNPAATVDCTPASGTTFVIGTTAVACTATSVDDTPPTVSKTFNITVLDTDLALAGVPANITVNATSSSGAVVVYVAPTAVDEAGDSPAAAVSCVPASGATYPVGTSTVTCTANSADDNPSTVSAKFTVTVLVDLRLNLVITPSTATTGTVVTGTVTLTNAGSVSRTVTLRLTVTFVSATGQTSTITSSSMTITLSAGQTVTRSLTFTVSSFMPRGNYSFTGTASDVTGSISSSAPLKVT